MPKRLSTEEFIKKARIIHGDRYDYSKVKYKNKRTKIKIICHTHGEFEQTPDSHVNGKSGCPFCAKNVKLTTSEFIRKAIEVHENKYDYSKVIYNNNKTKIEIICKKHGSFMQRPDRHLYGEGCLKCGVILRTESNTYSTEDFIKKSIELHGNCYDYSKVDYKNNKTKIKIICEKHGLFEQVAANHLRGSGCPTCSESQGEKRVRLFLENNNIKFIQQKKFNKCRRKRRLPFDFYLPKQNLLIEYNGKQHYEPIEYFGGDLKFLETQTRDQIKKDFAKSNGIKLIEIPYTEFDNIECILSANLIKTNGKDENN